jgi:23S rRNA (guanosine2251-2'-O)-methyltransferase
MSQSRLVIGIHSTREALKVRPGKITTLLLRDRWNDSQDLSELAELAKKFKVKVKQVPVSYFDKLSRSHQGVGAEVSESPELDLNKLKAKQTSLIVALDQVEDPQNLGAVIRSVWLMGADAVVIPKDRTSPITPTVTKIASGALEHIPIETVTNLHAWLKDMRDHEFWIYGFDSSGKNTLWQVKYPEKVILVLGAEGHGLRKPTISACDEILRIPQTNPEASFNLSVSAAVAMAEVSRQRLDK